jgi:hypothetical protein
MPVGSLFQRLHLQKSIALQLRSFSRVLKTFKRSRGRLSRHWPVQTLVARRGVIGVLAGAGIPEY